MTDDGSYRPVPRTATATIERIDRRDRWISTAFLSRVSCVVAMGTTTSTSSACEDERARAACATSASDGDRETSVANSTGDARATRSHDDSIALRAPALRSATTRARLMTPAIASELARALPSDRRARWTLKFDSDEHGLSFRGALLARCVGVGPVAVVVEPREGDRDEVFIAHASPSLVVSHEFGGDDFTSCWTFVEGEGLAAMGAETRAPALYCASGFTQYVNGLGFFGRAGRHRLFIDEHLESGHVEYGARAFGVRRVEIWALTERDDVDHSARDAERARAKSRAQLITQFTSSNITRAADEAARS